MPRVHLLISGRVQGVGFREWTVRTARGLDLAGWVLNRASGEVEIAAEGTDEALATFRAACMVGPRFASVARIEDLAPLSAPMPSLFERWGTV